MVAIEASNALHGDGDKVTGIDRKLHGAQSPLNAFQVRMRNIKGVLQGIDARAKDNRDKVVNGANTTFNWPTPFLALNPYVRGAPRGLKSVRGVDDNDQLERVRKRARIDETPDTIKDIVARIRNGAQVIPISHSHHIEYLICLDVKNTGQSTERNLNHLGRS
jgi:hypothetical protein